MLIIHLRAIIIVFCISLIFISFCILFFDVLDYLNPLLIYIR